MSEEPTSDRDRTQARAPIYFPVLREVVRHPKIGKVGCAVWGYVYGFHLQDKDAYPSIRKICEQVGASRSAVVRAIQALEEHGFLTVQERTTGKGRQTSSAYFATLGTDLERVAPTLRGRVAPTLPLRVAPTLPPDEITSSDPSPKGETGTPKSRTLHQLRVEVFDAFCGQHEARYSRKYRSGPADAKLIGDAIRDGLLGEFFDLDPSERKKFVDTFFEMFDNANRDLTISVRAWLNNLNATWERYEGGREKPDTMPRLSDIADDMMKAVSE